jgi:hypothetical protein
MHFKTRAFISAGDICFSLEPDIGRSNLSLLFRSVAVGDRHVRQHCHHLRVRDHIVIVEVLAKRGVCGDLGVPGSEVGMR